MIPFTVPRYPFFNFLVLLILIEVCFFHSTLYARPFPPEQLIYLEENGSTLVARSKVLVSKKLEAIHFNLNKKFPPALSNTEEIEKFRRVGIVFYKNFVMELFNCLNNSTKISLQQTGMSNYECTGESAKPLRAVFGKWLHNDTRLATLPSALSRVASLTKLLGNNTYNGNFWGPNSLTPIDGTTWASVSIEDELLNLFEIKSLECSESYFKVKCNVEVRN